MHRPRRWIGSSALAIAVALGAFAAPGSTDDADPPPDPAAGGSTVLQSGGDIFGTVSSQVIAAVPLVGNIALQAKIGAAGAQVEGEVRRANSQVADLGVLGTLAQLALTGMPTLTRLGIPASQFTGAFKLPAASAADSRSKTEARDRPVVPDVPLGPVDVSGAHQEAEAMEGKTAYARTELEDAGINLGLVHAEVNGGVAETVADATHVASTTSLGELRFLSNGKEIGALRGLVWSFEQAIDKPPVTSFRIGSGGFGSASYPLDSPAQLKALAQGLDNALKPFGLSLLMPEPRPGGGLTPLRLAFANSEMAAKFVRPAYDAALGKVVNQAESSVIGGAPETGLALTVANVVVGALTGQGGVAVEFGGSAGSIGRRPVEEFSYGSSFQQGPAALPETLPPAGTSDLAELPSASSAPTAAAPHLGTSNAPAAEPSRSVVPRMISAVLDEKAPAALIVVAGLAAAVALAAADRRRIAAMFDRSDRA